MKLGVVLALVLLSTNIVQASSVRMIEQIGAHYPVFIFEKSRNPENIMIAYTKVDSNCQLIKQNNLPILDLYWLIGRQSYKPVHPKIKSGVSERLKILPTTETNRFSVILENLKELDSDLGDAHMSVVSSQNNDGSCDVRGYLKLGPSDQGKVIQLTSIYSQVKRIASVEFVTLSGKAIETGEAVSRKYLAK